MCNHYYQNEIDKVRAELENIRTSDVSASTTLAFFNHSWAMACFLHWKNLAVHH